MQIGAVGYPTFVYNSNYVSAKSLGSLSAIPEDVLDSKVDYADSSKNVNPLRRGETKDLFGIIGSQMAMSRMNAARVMQMPDEKDTEGEVEKMAVPEENPAMMPEADQAADMIPEADPVTEMIQA